LCDINTQKRTHYSSTETEPKCVSGLIAADLLNCGIGRKGGIRSYYRLRSTSSPNHNNQPTKQTNQTHARRAHQSSSQDDSHHHMVDSRPRSKYDDDEEMTRVGGGPSELVVVFLSQHTFFSQSPPLTPLRTEPRQNQLDNHFCLCCRQLTIIIFNCCCGLCSAYTYILYLN
jgi:hypothetical protein